MTSTDLRQRATPQIRIRPHAVGDMAYVVHRHAVLYHQEYGFDITFEALVARIAADFIEEFDPSRYCSRIVEADGAIVGSAFVVPMAADASKTGGPTVAKLRPVYLEPHLRGAGIAGQLVEECMAFARGAGYGRMTLWTQDILLPTRRLYGRFGFQCVASKVAIDFGRSMVNETWEREL